MSTIQEQSAAPSSAEAAVQTEAGAAPAAARKPATASGKKAKRTVNHVVVRVLATFNNTHITVSDASGEALAWAKAGQHFKGSRKRTPHAAQIAAEGLIDKLRALGVRTIEVVLKGAGPGRDSAVKPFGSAGFNVLIVKDATPVPHNGCRPRKTRRG